METIVRTIFPFSLCLRPEKKSHSEVNVGCTKQISTVDYTQNNFLIVIATGMENISFKLVSQQKIPVWIKLTEVISSLAAMSTQGKKDLSRGFSSFLWHVLPVSPRDLRGC